MRTLLLVVAGAAIALPVAAQSSNGFSAHDLKNAAQQASAQSSRSDGRINAAHTAALRAGFVLSPQRGWSLLSTSEADVLHLALGEKRVMGDEALQWFMRGAITGAGNDDLTGLYNPIADVWLIFSWRTIGGTPRLQNAIFVPGALLRVGTSQIPWTRATGGLGDVLSGQVASSTASFQTVDGNSLFANMHPVRATTADAAFNSVFDWMNSTRALDSKDGPTQWRTLHEKLVGLEDKTIVGALPRRVRATLLPAGVTRNTDTTSVLLVSPLAPHLIVAADYRHTAKPQLSLINLSNGSAVLGPQGVQP